MGGRRCQIWDYEKGAVHVELRRRRLYLKAHRFFITVIYRILYVFVISSTGWRFAMLHLFRMRGRFPSPAHVSRWRYIVSINILKEFLAQLCRFSHVFFYYRSALKTFAGVCKQFLRCTSFLFFSSWVYVCCFDVSSFNLFDPSNLENAPPFTMIGQTWNTASMFTRRWFHFSHSFLSRLLVPILFFCIRRTAVVDG